MYKFFCGNCGKKFSSETPERDAHGFLSDISCPNCGAWDVYPDTKDGAAQSIKDLMDYEDKMVALREG